MKKNNQTSEKALKSFTKKISSVIGVSQKTSNEKGKLLNKKNSLKNKNDQDADITENLAQVYTDGNGDIPDMTKLDNNQKPLWKKGLYWSIGILIVLFIAAFSGFLVFMNWQGESFTNERIILKIQPPVSLSSGSVGSYAVIITNKEKVDLFNVRLKLDYPDNFEFISSEPEAVSDDGAIWDFSVIKSGETKKIEIQGNLTASVGSVLSFGARLDFKPANLNAEFKQEAIIDAIVSSSVFNLDIAGPEKTLINQEVEYNIKYANTSENIDFTDLQLVVIYPEGFKEKSLEPAPSDRNGELIWNISELAADEKGEINIVGDYSTTAIAGDKTFTARLQLKKDADYYPQSVKEKTTTVVKDRLTLNFVANGSAQDQPINFNDYLNYSLTFRNTGQESIKSIKLTAIMDSQIIDWSTLEDSAGGHWQGNKIEWTGNQVPKLLKLSPGDEGELTWRVRVKDSSVINNKEISRFGVTTKIVAEIEYESGAKSTVSSNEIVNIINSDVELSASARYYNSDNVPLGSGPIQPEVGEKSTYNILIKIANNLHNLKDVMVTATLPKNINWANREDHFVGSFTFNDVAGKATWIIPTLAKSKESANLTFNLEIEPTDEDFGRVLILLSDIVLTATDTVTGDQINKELSALTTSFEDPILGRISGVVR